MRKKLAAHRVAVVVTRDAPMFELAVPCEVFGIDRPELIDPWYELQVCGIEPNTRVACGFTAQEAGDLSELVHADTVVVPSCANVCEDTPAALVDALRAAHAAGARIAGICTGAFALAAAGLLDGRRATTHWMHAEELARRHPAVHVDPKVLYAEDDGIFTSAGTAAGIDLCLELVRRDHGATVANALARRLVTPPHREGGQAQFVELPAVGQDGNSLAPLLEWARTRLDEPVTLDDFARQANLSRRTLARRFEEALGMSPLRWLQQERIRHAQHLLETTMLSIDRVAARSGLGSAANLRRHLTRHLRVSPNRYRRAFRAKSSSTAETFDTLAAPERLSGPPPSAQVPSQN